MTWLNVTTTAVLAIDQIQYLLPHPGSRHPDEGQRLDEQGLNERSAQRYFPEAEYQAMADVMGEKRQS